MNSLTSLIGNISNNFNFLKQDYIGINISLPILFNFLVSILMSILVVIVFYLIGLKIKQLFFKEDNKIINFFIGIAFGFILSASGILVLGMLSVLYKPVLYLYVILLILIAIYPLKTLKKRLSNLLIIKDAYTQQFIKNKFANIAVLAFVLISFLRLIPPDVGVDALWYHTDYPQVYINSHSMMTIDPDGKNYPAVTPTLSDMFYIFTNSISMKESSRFIHFSFYILSILLYLTVFTKRYSFSAFAALLFVTCPIVIQVAPSAYAEFPWIFCWLLGVFLITAKNRHKLKDIVIPSILIGGVLAIKLWMLPFYGVFILYILFLNFRQDKKEILKLLLLFTLICFSIPLLWYIRSFIITGNPIFPSFRPLPNGDSNNPFAISNILSSFNLAGLKSRLLGMFNVSPFSIIGFVVLIITFLKIKNFKFKNRPFIIFAFILIVTQLIINYSYHRFLMPFYSIIALPLGFGIFKFLNFNRFFKYTFYLLFTGFFLYYFINTLFILPYGLGFANKNKYLSRVLSRDNSSFYDYNNQFLKLINKNDVVAAYGMYGFYYADFNYIFAEDIFAKNNKSLQSLKKKGATKLVILGYDIKWLCDIEKLKDCSPNNYKLLTYYKFPTDAKSQYLYLLK